MCGIVGVMTGERGHYGSPLAAFFKQALFADTFRGSDSTGIAMMDTNESLLPYVYKKALPAPDFIQLGLAIEAMKPLNDWSIMLGHNRAATKGGVKDHTAHPFQIGNITLVHNGTVSNHKELVGGEDFVVDSEAITNAINEKGIEYVVKTIRGAFTLIWHDAEDNSLNIIRNDERPLSIGICSDSDSVLFASERGMLEWIAGRDKINLKLSKVFEPEIGVHHKYFVNKHKSWKTSPILRKLDLVAPLPTRSAYTGYSIPMARLKELGLTDPKKVEFEVVGFTPNSYNSQAKEGTLNCQISNGTKTLHVVSMNRVTEDQYNEILDKGAYIIGDISSIYNNKGQPIVIINNQGWTVGRKKSGKEIVTLVEGYNSEMITEDAFYDATKTGCSVCTQDLLPEDASSVIWLDRLTPMCEDCGEDYRRYGIIQ